MILPQGTFLPLLRCDCHLPLYFQAASMFSLSFALFPQDTLFGGSISRDLVAEVAVESLFYLEASYKIVEIIESVDAPKKSFKDIFASIPE